MQLLHSFHINMSVLGALRKLTIQTKMQTQLSLNLGKSHTWIKKKKLAAMLQNEMHHESAVGTPVIMTR